MKCSRTIVALRPPCALVMKGFLESYARDAAARKRSRDSGENRQNVEIKKIYRQRIDDDCVGASPNPSSSSSTSIENVYNGPPHFLVIGAQKAGTMAVVKNLNKHPEIACLSEEHYFDLGWHSRSISSYRSLLCKSQASGTEKIILGEKTPEYGYVEECHNRIKSVCKQGTKFIMMIRDPVKRAYSAWNMNVKRNFEVNLFDECVDKNFKNLSEYRSYGTAEYHYVQRGFYLDQILRFLETFPDRENLLIVVAEHIRNDPETHYDRIFDFLGARRSLLDYEDDHIGSYTTPMSPNIAEKLRKVYEPHNERLFKFLGYRIPEWGVKSSAAIPPIISTLGITTVDCVASLKDDINDGGAD